MKGGKEGWGFWLWEWKRSKCLLYHKAEKDIWENIEYDADGNEKGG